MEVSFAHEVKTELCAIRSERACCLRAALYGLLLFARSFAPGPGGIALQTEHDGVAAFAADALKSLYGVAPLMRSGAHAAGRAPRLLSVESAADVARIRDDFGCGDRTLALRINRAVIENECCAHSFLRGVFLSCGSVVDPEKDYHLEFVSPHLPLGRDLIAFLRELGFGPKITRRKGNGIIYFKESEQIEDLLTYMGAARQSLELMNVKVYKDLRNKVNRVTNCETANIDKTVAASAAQVEAIHRIYALRGPEFLPEELRELAALRLENPEMSLRELGERLRVRISRSGVNHRLRKIEEIAQKLGPGA